MPTEFVGRADARGVRRNARHVRIGQSGTARSDSLV